MSQSVESWGRSPRLAHKAIQSMEWPSDIPDFNDNESSFLPRGYGRSYGDSCLNENGTLIDCRPLHRFIHLDTEHDLLRCEAGVRLDEILELIVPRGYFLPVTPGTKHISVGGAIANDVHGKNHHVAGTFGCHLRQFELLRSNGERMLCSKSENAEMFAATIGGLGLTGLIVWAEFGLTRIPSPYILQHTIKFGHVDAYLEHSRESDARYDYVVSWIDCTSGGPKMGRGIFTGGNFVAAPGAPTVPARSDAKLALPFELPAFVMNGLSVRVFNSLYYHRLFKEHSEKRIPYTPFFYPLDAIAHWNKAYGKNGFFQYQFVVGFEEARETLHEVLRRTAKHGKASFVTVLKNFGPQISPGMLSFPKEGVTLALDFRNEGQSTLRLLSELDSVIEAHNGRLYPAKDARMSASHFQKAYPRWQEFAAFIDPKFSSSFWRRVTQQ